MRRLSTALAWLAVAGLALFWVLTRPDALSEGALAALTGDAASGERIFLAAGCASCHAAADAEGEARLILAGGQRFPSPFGTFVAPNISPDPGSGIGGWTALDLANAMLRGISPDGRHYYPAFPYTSYANMALQDVVDLKAYLDTLPPVARPSQPHEVPFPFNIRRALGGWKLLFAGKGFMLQGDLTPELERGRYLAEALGHCSECHTPRNALGGPDRARWLWGAPSPDGKGKIPAITPDKLTWSSEEIAYYLETGFTPEFDSAGGKMTAVIANTAQLPAADRAALAAYLKAVPAAE